VLSNVMLAVDDPGMEAPLRAGGAHLLKATGLQGFENKKPYELSAACPAGVDLPRPVHDRRCS